MAEQRTVKASYPYPVNMRGEQIYYFKLEFEPPFNVIEMGELHRGVAYHGNDRSGTLRIKHTDTDFVADEAWRDTLQPLVASFYGERAVAEDVMLIYPSYE